MLILDIQVLGGACWRKHGQECTQQEKDRDGCPKIVNLGSAKTDLFYERKKYGFKEKMMIVAVG